MVYHQAIFHFKVGEVILARHQGELYYAKIVSVQLNKKMVRVLFDDGSKDEVAFNNIHSVNETTSDIICVICKKDTAEADNDIVLCDDCNVGYHQRCHQPCINSSVLLPEAPWQCCYCVDQKPNPYIQQNPFVQKTSDEGLKVSKDKKELFDQKPNTTSMKATVKLPENIAKSPVNILVNKKEPKEIMSEKSEPLKTTSSDKENNKANKSQTMQQKKSPCENIPNIKKTKTQCQHSDGHTFEDENILGDISIGHNPTGELTRADHHHHRNNKSSSKQNLKMRKVVNKKTDNDAESRHRYAMEFPRHNWLLERLKSENKINEGVIKIEEQKLQEKVNKEKAVEKMVEVERKQKEEKVKMKKIEVTLQKQKVLNANVRPKSDSEIEEQRQSEEPIRRCYSYDPMISKNQQDIGIKILSVVSLSKDAPVLNSGQSTTMIQPQPLVFKPKILQNDETKSERDNRVLPFHNNDDIIWERKEKINISSNAADSAFKKCNKQDNDENGIHAFRHPTRNKRPDYNSDGEPTNELPNDNRISGDHDDHSPPPKTNSPQVINIPSSTPNQTELNIPKPQLLYRMLTNCSPTTNQMDESLTTELTKCPQIPGESEAQSDITIPEPQTLTNGLLNGSASKINDNEKPTSSINIPKPQFLTNEKPEVFESRFSTKTSPHTLQPATDKEETPGGITPKDITTAPNSFESKQSENTKESIIVESEQTVSSASSSKIYPRISPVKTYHPLSRETTSKASLTAMEKQKHLISSTLDNHDLNQHVRRHSPKFIPERSPISAEYESFEKLRFASERIANYPAHVNERTLTKNISHSKDHNHSFSEVDLMKLVSKISPAKDYRPAIAGQSFKLSSKQSPTTNDYLVLRDPPRRIEYKSLSSLKFTGKSRDSGQDLKQIRAVQLPIKPISPDRHLTNDTRKRLYDQITNRQPFHTRQQQQQQQQYVQHQQQQHNTQQQQQQHRQHQHQQQQQHQHQQQQQPIDIPSKYRLTEKRYRHQFSSINNEQMSSPSLSPDRPRHNRYSFMSDLQQRHDEEHAERKRMPSPPEPPVKRRTRHGAESQTLRSPPPPPPSNIHRSPSNEYQRSYHPLSSSHPRYLAESAQRESGIPISRYSEAERINLRELMYREKRNEKERQIMLNKRFTNPYNLERDGNIVEEKRNELLLNDRQMLINKRLTNPYDLEHDRDNLVDEKRKGHLLNDIQMLINKRLTNPYDLKRDRDNLVDDKRKGHLLNDRQMLINKRLTNPYDLEHDRDNLVDEKRRFLEKFHHKYPLQQKAYSEKYKRDSSHTDLDANHPFGGIADKKKSSRDRCKSCQEEAQFLCSGCRSIWYCSKKCQHDDWETHIHSCV